MSEFNDLTLFFDLEVIENLNFDDFEDIENILPENYAVPEVNMVNDTFYIPGIEYLQEEDEHMIASTPAPHFTDNDELNFNTPPHQIMNAIPHSPPPLNSLPQLNADDILFELDNIEGLGEGLNFEDIMNGEPLTPNTDEFNNILADVHNVKRRLMF
jgi:hypothetical protein